MDYKTRKLPTIDYSMQPHMCYSVGNLSEKVEFRYKNRDSFHEIEVVQE